MPHRQIIRDIQAEAFKPLYLLHGEEPFFIDEVSKALELAVVEESMKDFNQVVLYGREATIDQVLESARRFPMMADRQLVLMREAQEWPAWRRSEDMAKLEAYAQSPIPSTVLVFCFKNKKAATKKAATKKPATKKAAIKGKAEPKGKPSQKKAMVQKSTAKAGKSK
ncbi:hypothetical protein N8204_01450 [Flavobacteriales bacterium]|nr:hypothetical protein [Flavobacteriales bacterium]